MGTVGAVDETDHSTRLAIVSVVFIALGIIGGFVFTGDNPPANLTTIAPPTVTLPSKDQPMIDAHGVKIDGEHEYLIGHSWKDQSGIQWVKTDQNCRIGYTESRVGVFTEDEAISLVTIHSAGIPTAVGVEVGTEESTVEKVYGRSPDESGKLVMTDGADELVIGIADGRVAYMWARRIGSSVGC